MFHSTDHQRGSSIVELVFTLGISGILLLGITGFVAKQLGIRRQLADKSDLETARRMIRMNFSCENSLNVQVGDKIAKCEDSYPILNRHKTPVFAAEGRFGSSNVFVKMSCVEDLGMFFDYRINNQPYRDMHPGEPFCSEYFSPEPSLGPQKNKFVPVTCAAGRIIVGIKGGIPVCGYSAADLRGPPSCAAPSPTEAPVCTFSNPKNPNASCSTNEDSDGRLIETCSN